MAYALFLLMILVSSCASKKLREPQQVCDTVVVHNDEEINFSEDEIRLLCGDQSSEAYKIVPAYQASFLATGFLQTRGYINPRFEIEGRLLRIHPGEKKEITGVDLKTSDHETKEDFEKLLFRHYKEETLTPKTLNNLEEETLLLYRNNGYPCAEVESTADSQTGKISLKISGLKKFPFGEFTREPVDGLYNEAFDRFTSFSPEDDFKDKELELTEKRLLRSEVVQASYFQEKCDLENNKFSLTQHFIVGDPKTIRFGVGASTEVGPMVRVKWSNLRYGNMASRLEAQLQGSFKEQLIRLMADNYFWKAAPRRSLLSELEIRHEDQDTFEELTAELRPHLQWTRDNWERFWLWSAGPTLISSRFDTSLNKNDQTFTTVALEGELVSKTHDYESYEIHPEEGEYYQLNLDGRHSALGFEEPLLRMDWTMVSLWHPWSWGKGAGIIGVRVNSGSTWVKDTALLERLPPSVKFYGGGSEDIRGFKLDSIPNNNGLGSLTKFVAKLELRKTHVFIPTVEAMAFFDSGFFGQKSWHLDNRYFYSPGIGLRWLSPIGLVQTYAARGLSSKSIRDEGNFYFVGLGGTF